MRPLFRPIITVPLGVATAVALSVQVPLKWWHPYCDVQDDGPGYWGLGFVLPFLEPTGVSSGDLLLRLPVFALNIAILAIPLTLLIAMAGRAWPTVLSQILGTAVVVVAVISILQLSIAMVPTMSLTEGSDPLLAYRPEPLLNVGEHRACFY